MNRDPSTVNKNTKIMVKLLAEIINDFFEPLSYKTISLFTLGLVVMVLFSECIVGKTKKSEALRVKKQG